MSKKSEVTPKNIQSAIKALGKYRLGERLDAIDGSQAHRILPQIWPVINEIRLLADACAEGKLQAVP